jgi:hypothetical protein
LANILGSNMFEIFRDFHAGDRRRPHRQGTLVSNVSPLHLVTVVAVLIMGAFVIATPGQPSARARIRTYGLAPLCHRRDILAEQFRSVPLWS